ncbi:MFS transporter [Aquimarina macrocephali]|uniref:MFS transporter n=1 Tax=Aquimarina macrocephali TaxID=666563 RepID=UPI000465217C|nr:MFS transporter [Aquimarina macrocephali]
MKNISIKISLFINYFIFAILLNSVGIVILKSLENYHVDEIEASTLEWFKDLPIALVSFLIASFLPRIGYKKAILSGLLISFIGCLGMYYGNSFWSAKLLFAAIGVSFALVKVSVYTLIGIITETKRAHNSLMSTIEGVFMIGIATAYFLFPGFNNDNDPDAWLRVYWLLAALIFVSFLLLFFTRFEEGNEIPGVNLLDDIRQMMLLCTKMLVIVFVGSAFLFVMVEQGVMTWLPTFYKRVLQLPPNVSIMMSSVFAISLAIGRIGAGILSKRIPWVYILTVCIGLAILMVVFILPKTLNVEVQEIQKITDIPWIGYAFPLIGLCIAPIYPLINSAVLSALPKKLHSSMTGLIVVFSALGGTTGSTIVGWLFKNVGAQQAFYYTIIPMILLLLTLLVLHKLTRNNVD